MEQKLQKIIQKLEAKLQPLHEENQNLKSKLEELKLDHELALEQARVAELELAESTQHSRQIKELTDQVEALETLRKLSDELERDQRKEITHLEHQLAELELANHQSKEQRQQESKKIINDPSDTLKQQLSLLQLELDTARFELRKHQIGLLDFLHEVCTGFDLERMRYMLATYGKESDTRRLQTLYDAFKTGSVGTRDLLESIKLVAGELDTKAIHAPNFNPQAARFYLMATTKDQRVESLSETNLAKVFEDPSQLEEVSKEVTSANEDHPNLEAEHIVEPIGTTLSSEHAEQLETLKFKVDVLTNKAARAAQLAISLNEAETTKERIQVQSQKLESRITELREQLAIKDSEITTLKAAQVPDLDSATYQHTLGLLSDTINLLHTRTAPFTLEPLEVRPARNLSAFAGTEIVNQVWNAIDSFEVPNRRKGWIEQMGKLSVIDSI